MVDYANEDKKRMAKVGDVYGQELWLNIPVLVMWLIQYAA